MATQLKKVVAPSGGDYTSLEACMNANEQDLVTADKYFDVEISGTWSSADTTAVTIHNYTTDATHYINIYTTGSARHDGTAYKSGAYKLYYYIDGTVNKSGTSALLISQSGYLTLDGVVIHFESSGYGGHSDYVSGLRISSSNYTITAKNNIVFRGSAVGGNHAGINVQYSGGNENAYIINNVVFGWDSAPGITSYKTGNAYLYNNTSYGNGVGINQSYSPSILINNLSYNNTTDYTSDCGNNSSDTHNLSKDATAPAYNTYYRNKTLTFVNTTAGSEDFHLVSTDTDAIDKGTDLSGTFTTDIDGTTRTGTWDIGADEYVSTGAAATGFMTCNTGYWG